MKRFKLETGHIVKVDDCDAHLMRSMVWRANTTKCGIAVYRSQGGVSRGGDRRLSAKIIGAAPYIVHLNNDPLDFRRANRKGVTRKEWFDILHALGHLQRTFNAS